MRAGNHARVVFYAGVRFHKTLRMTMAMAAGVSDRHWSVEDLAEMVEAGQPKPGRRGPYKKREVISPA